MPLDRSLPYAGVAFKASHNSYDRDEQPISSHYEALGTGHWQGRCRGLELDLNPSSHNWLWSVNHIGGYTGSADQQLPAYLADLAAWHADDPHHDILTVTLDLKGAKPIDREARSTSQFAPRLDATLEAALPGAIFKPMDLRRHHETLLDAAADWPRLHEMVGKVLFYLSGDEGLKQAYLDGQATDGCCFVDLKFNPGDTFAPEQHPDRVFYNFDMDAWPAQGGPDLKRALRRIADDGRCLTRGYVINNSQVWAEARAAGLSIFATDKVRKHDWATVGADGFAPRLG